MFKVRDLLLVAAVIVGGCVVAYKDRLLEYAKPVIEPVQYAIDTPNREAALREQVDVLAGEIERRGEEIASLRRELEDSGRVIDAGSAEMQRLDDELARMRQRFSALCQHLLTLGQDVPNGVAER